MQQSDCSLSGEKKVEGEEVLFVILIMSCLCYQWQCASGPGRGQTSPQQNWKSLKRGDTAWAGVTRAER